MRTLKFIGLTIVLMQLLSCWPEADMWERTYQIKNSTGYDITIRAFESFNGIGSFEDITLLESQIYTGVKASGSNFDALNDSDNGIPTTSFSFSRFIVVYNNEKSIIHSVDFDENNDIIFSEPINRHLLRGGNYTDIGNDIYEFVLTEEDYNNAIPCDGDCLD